VEWEFNSFADVNLGNNELAFS